MYSVSVSDDYSEKLMRLAVEASPNGMVLVDVTGNIILANASAEALFGFNRNELIGQPIEVLVPERFSGQHPELRGNYYGNPETRAMGHGRDLYGQHRNGNEIPVEIGLNPINIGGQTYVLAAIVDITERQRAQEMMRLAVEAAPNGMILTDAEGRIALVNSLVETLFGYRRDELVGCNIDMLVPQHFRAHHPELRKSYFKKPVSRAMGKGRDLFALHKRGREFPVEIGLNPLHTEQGTMILASVVDITERKQNEEKLKANLKEKEVLLSEIHHRVKNNLQIIDSLIGIQSDRISGSTAVTALKDSQNRVRSIAKIHQILYESQDFSEVDFSSVLTSLVDNLTQSYGIDASKISIKLDATDILLPIDRGIPLGLIVNELVTNVFKHGFPDNKRGEIKIVLRELENNKISLEVEDNGIGIPEDSSILECDSLGLHLVETLVEQLDGEIDIHRRNPTRFTLLIPYKVSGAT